MTFAAQIARAFKLLEDIVRELGEIKLLLRERETK
jgi:hypothetical protein